MFNKTYFVTGGTGLIGSYLIKILLENNNRVFALVRKKEGDSFNRLAEKIFFWDDKILVKKDKNLIVFEGDTSTDDLGLSKADLSVLKKQTNEIFHCAAATQFAGKLDQLINVNVHGTERILRLAKEWSISGELTKTHYLSTAYICGNTDTVYTETDFNVGQQFDSPYQLSKFEAEKIVRKYRDLGLTINIYRPSAVAGEAITGKTFTFNQAIYQSFKALSLDLTDSLPVNPAAQINIVFVDELCESIFLLSKEESTSNKVFHTFSSSSFPCRELIDLLSQKLLGKRLTYVDPSKFEKENKSLALKTILKNNLFFIQGVRLDSTATNNRLKKLNFSFKNFNGELLDSMLNYCITANFLRPKNVKQI